MSCLFIGGGGGGGGGVVVPAAVWLFYGHVTKKREIHKFYK